MKQLSLLLATVMICASVSAQEGKVDTVRIGNIMIIKKKGAGDNRNEREVRLGRKTKKKSNFEINTGMVDIGFASFTDKTNYAGVPSGFFANRPGQPAIGPNDFKLRFGKSVNINVWFVMQRMNISKHYVNLLYGLGVELNNYRFKSNISFKENGANPYPPYNVNTGAFVLRDSIAFSKNKLAADYLTVPLMLDFTTNPQNRDRGISLAAGISAGYLYSQRNKQKSDERGKARNKGDYDMERFKIAYVAQLGLGPVRLYGSYSPKSIFSNGLDFRPFNVGVRLGDW